MVENRIFKLIWRFNAIAIMCAAVLALVCALLASVFIFKDITRDRHAANVVNTNADDIDAQVASLGRVIDIDGSNNVMIPLNVEQDYAMGSFSKSAASVRNYLFVNANPESKRWLLPSSDSLIYQTNQLRDTKPKSNATTANAILYYLVTSDTNGDKSLTLRDEKTVALSRLDGTQYTEVLKGASDIHGYKVRDNDALMLIYQKKKTAYSKLIDLKSFETSAEMPLPPAP